MPFIFSVIHYFHPSHFIFHSYILFSPLITNCTFDFLLNLLLSSLALVPLFLRDPLFPFHILFSPSCILFRSSALSPPFIPFPKQFVFFLSFLCQIFPSVILQFLPSHLIYSFKNFIFALSTLCTVYFSLTFHFPH